MTAQTLQSIRKAFSIARAYVDAEYSKNHLRGVIDPVYARLGMEKQVDLIELSEELQRGEREFNEELSNDNNN